MDTSVAVSVIMDGLAAVSTVGFVILVVAAAVYVFKELKGTPDRLTGLDPYDGDRLTQDEIDRQEHRWGDRYRNNVYISTRKSRGKLPG